MYGEVPTTDGLYLIDYELVQRIVHDSYYLQKKNDGAKEQRVKEGWGLPETYHYEIDVAGARAYAESMRVAFHAPGQVASLFRGHAAPASRVPSGREVEDFKDRLFELERAGRGAAEELKKKQKEASRRSMENIHKKAAAWGTAAEVAKFTRNASADVILVTGTVMSGGTALALGAGGSLLKGAYKVQDTGNVAAGVMESTVSFVTFAIPAPDAGMSKGMARTLVFTKAKMEFTGKTAVALVEGKSLGDAALTAGVDVGLGQAFDKVGGALLPEARMKELLKGGLLGSVPMHAGLRLLAGGAIGATHGRLSEAASQQLIAFARRKRKSGNPGLRNVAMSAPVLVDLAVVGPDRSAPPRRW